MFTIDEIDYLVEQSIISRNITDITTTHEILVTPTIAEGTRFNLIDEEGYSLPVVYRDGEWEIES